MLGCWDVGMFASLHPSILTSQHPNYDFSVSDDLSIQGTLAETTVPDLFRSLTRSSETAVVTLDTGGRVDTIYFSDGRIIYASTSDPDMGIAEALLRSG